MQYLLNDVEKTTTFCKLKANKSKVNFENSQLKWTKLRNHVYFGQYLLKVLINKRK